MNPGGEAELLRRQRALARLIDAFNGKVCDFHNADCVRMARAHLVALGHAPPPLPCYRGPAGARRALRAAGFADLAGLFDSLLPRIAPARMLPGDLVLLAGTERLGCMTVFVGGKVMGWHQDAPVCAMIVPHRIEAAWRV